LFAQDELIGAIFQMQLQNSDGGARMVPSQDQNASFGTEQHEETAPSPCMLPRRQHGLRVVIHDRFPGDGSEKHRSRAAGKLVFLPDSLQELMEVAEAKFGKAARRVLTVDGAEVDDVLVGLATCISQVVQARAKRFSSPYSRKNFKEKG